MLYESVRQEVLKTTVELYRKGLLHLTSGNVSARASAEHVAITPSGVACEGMRPEDIVIVDLAGRVVDGHYKPSSETPMHTLILRECPDTGAIVHTHSLYAVVFAVLGRSIPQLSMEGLALGGPVLVADWVCPGTEELGRAALSILLGPPRRHAVLLRNHGGLVVAPDLERALGLAWQLEFSAHVYHLALQAGRPEPFTAAQIAEIETHYQRMQTATT
jgi:ribulose-5-phosphate 4-epimerase/fuculose-1-phosphate aldolase